MPKGPQGQRRPADAVACAVMVAQIATGELPAENDHDDSEKKKAGGIARKAALTAEKRSEIAKIAAETRWRGHGGD